MVQGDESYAIYADGDLNIVLIGRNKVINDKHSIENSCYGIRVAGILNIFGNGTLNVSAIADEASYDIMAFDNISISGGTVTVKTTGALSTAMNKVPYFSSFSGCTALASTSANAETKETYNPANHGSYKYIKIEPAPTPTAPAEFSVTYANGIVIASSSEEGTFQLIFASYNGTKLQSIEVVPITFAELGKFTTEVPADLNTAGATDLKIMLWRSLRSMKPLCENEAISL